MALVLKDRVKVTTTTTGTGALTLGAAQFGYQDFSGFSNGDTTYYTIVDSAAGDWEVGLGTYSSAGPTLTRTTVLASSTGAAVNFGAGLKDVFVSYPAGRAVTTDGAVFTGPITVPAGATGAQAPQAQEIPNLLGITGQVAFFARSTAPTGWLKANGAEVSRTTYAALFAAIGTTFGAGDGATTFNLPDMRGYALRAWDDGRGVDSGRVFGSTQADGIKQSSFRINRTGNIGSSAASVFSAEGEVSISNNVGTGSINFGFISGTDQKDRVNIGSAPETRMKNIALLACIKY